MHKSPHKNKLFAMPLAARNVILYILFILGAGLYCVSCIKRDNPFDPIFDKIEHKVASTCSQETLSVFQAKCSAIIIHTDSLANKAKLLLQGFSSASKAGLDRNTEIENANRGISEKNQTIEVNNSLQTFSELLKDKTLLDTLLFLELHTADIIALTTSVALDSMTLSISILAGLAATCPDYADSVKKLNDSSMAAFARATKPIRSSLTSIYAIEKSIDSSDSAIADSNDLIYRENDRIKAYNDSIYKIKWIDRAKTLPVITSGDSLHRQMQPGDTFIVEGSLELNDNLKLSFHGTASDHIALIGDPLTPNSITMKNGSIFLDSAEYIDIANLTIRGSSESGIRVLNNSNNITLNGCTIEGNQGYGLAIFKSGMTVTNCRIFNNGGGGIQFQPASTDFQLNLDNVLIVKNFGVGVDLTTPLTDLKFVTISHNTSDGIRILSPYNSSVAISTSIVSFNGGFGISREDGNAGGIVEFGSVDFFGNLSGNVSSDVSGEFLSIDPNFNDTANTDFSIAPSGALSQQIRNIGYTGK
jgi:parallel beta-helix repeat protein